MKGIIVRRTLVDLRQKNIPVWVINLSSRRTKLSRGTEIPVCKLVACITLKAQSVPDHLQDLYEGSTNGLNQEQATKVASLLKEYGDVYSKGPNDIGGAKRTTHKINMGCAIPLSKLHDKLHITKTSSNNCLFNVTRAK